MEEDRREQKTWGCRRGGREVQKMGRYRRKGGAEDGEVQKKGRCRRWRGAEDRHEQKTGMSTLTTGTGKHIYKHIPVRRWRVITDRKSVV